MVWEAYQTVKANHGAAGVDGQSIEAFESDLKGNLYKIWNRMSSGSYFPPPVRLVEIPKANGGSRPLGIPICRSYCTSFQKGWGLSDGGPAPPSARFWFLRPIAATTSAASACAGGRSFPVSA
jgi:hypothetical protein